MHIISKRDNRCVVQNCQISQCDLVGIYLQGVNSEAQVLRCFISNINGPGVKINRGARSKV